jgi:cardiolipin synthase
MGSIGLPNYITLLRLLVIPVISFFYLREHYGWALVLLIFAGISDLVDGALARFLKQRTKLGAILDPAADKFLMLVSFLTLAWVHQVPIWLVLLVILRDVYIVFGVTFLKFTCKKLYIRPTYLSKMNTFFQLLFIFLSMTQTYLKNASYGWSGGLISFIDLTLSISIYVVAFVTFMSGLHYTLIGIAIFQGRGEKRSLETDLPPES